jgi:hypothetical protein
MLTTRPNPASRESLEDLVEKLAEHCRAEIEGGDQWMAKAFVILKDGSLEVIATPFRNVQEKALARAFVFARCRKMDAAAVVLVHDIWHVRTRQGSAAHREVERLGNLEQHSQRGEAVMVLLCTRGYVLWKLWPYRRTAAGIDWAEAELHEAGPDTARLSHEWDPWATLRSAN